MRSLLYLYDLNVYLHFLPIILGGILFVLKRFPPFFLFIFLSCCVSTTADIIATSCSHRGIHNAFIFHGYNILDGLIMLLFFQGLIQSNRFQRIIPLLFDTIGCFAVLYSLSIGLSKFPSMQVALNTVLIIGMVLMYFYEVFYFEYKDNLSTNPQFWIVSMLLVSYVGNLALHLMTEQAISGSLSISIYYVNVVLLILTHFVFTFTLWMGRVRKV